MALQRRSMQRMLAEGLQLGFFTHDEYVRLCEALTVKTYANFCMDLNKILGMNLYSLHDDLQQENS